MKKTSKPTGAESKKKSSFDIVRNSPKRELISLKDLELLVEEQKQTQKTK